MSVNLFSTFSGTGALDAAVGPGVRLVCDSYKPARQLLQDRYPGVATERDVTKLHLSAWRSTPGVRVLTGGFPCNDLSVAGKGAGAEEGSGTRSALGWEMPRLAAELDAHLVVHENVPAAMKKVYPALGERYRTLGYSTRTVSFSAAQVGSPHIRRRALLVASRSQDACEEVLAGLPQPAPLQREARFGACVPTPTVVDRSWGKTREAWEAQKEHFRQTTGAYRGDGPWTYWQDFLTLGVHDKEHQNLLAQWETVSEYPLPHGGGSLDTVSEQDVCDMMEWCMGLRPGLVTRRGLSISAQRRLIGNAVVPQAVGVALRYALEDLTGTLFSS